MPNLLGLWYVPAILALIPAAFRLRRGWSLARHADDPLLPERLLGGRHFMGFVFALVLMLQLAWGAHAWWSMPLQFTAFLAAGWPLRRALFGETWSVGSYVWFYVRLVVAIYGFWFLLVASPWITDLDGLRGWAVAAVVGAVLLAWNEQYGQVLRFLMRATPITTPALVTRFREIIAKTTVIPPDVEYVDMRGGVFVNALALPDTRRPSVLFTSTLLERFDEDEIAAIFAHEVAHLEHYNPAYLQRLRRIGWLMIGTTVSIRPLLQSVAPSYEWLTILAPFMVLAFMLVRGSHKQKHETESDLRSAALTGDSEVMVRALIKLHQMMKLPRRLDPSLEANASHPSLARRIQAIRAASGAPAAALPAAVTFRNAATTVTLHADRLVWEEGAVTAHTLAYAELHELRIDSDAKGSMRIVASDPAGRKWSMPLAGEDVVRAQAALDVVDARLHPTPVSHDLGRSFKRLAIFLCVVAAMGAGQVAAVIVAGLAGTLVEKPLLRAAGVAGLAGGLLTLRDGYSSSMAWILVLGAVLVLFLAYRDKRDFVSPVTWRLVAVVGVLAVLMLLPILLAGGGLLHTHQAARNWPGAIVLSLAFATAALSRRGAAWRTAAAAAVLVSGMLVAVSSTQALDALLGDPFLAGAAPIEPEPLRDRPVAAIDLDFQPNDLLLSPAGLAVAAVATDDRRKETTHFGRPGQPLEPIAGGAMLFVDDRRLFVVERIPGASRLKLVDVDTHAVAWEKTLDLMSVSLSIDRAASSWQALGFGAADQIVRISGALDGGATERQEWIVPGAGEDSAEFPLWSKGSKLLLRSTSYVPSAVYLHRLGQPWAAWLAPWRSESVLVMHDGSAARELLRSSLDVNCFAGAFIDDAAVCTAFDGSRTHVASLDPDDGAVTPIAVFDGTVVLDYEHGWLTGWLRAVPLALHVATRKLVRLDPDAAAPGRAGYFINGEGALGVVQADVDSATVSIYRVAAAASRLPTVK